MTGDLRTADHWWWRPGWAPGRSFYTWHCTFREQFDVHRLARVSRTALGGLPGLDLVPDRWLHLTVQGLGFTDEVSSGDVEAIVRESRARLDMVPAFEVRLHRPVFTPEAIRWDPGGPVDRVRRAIRAAIGSVWSVVPEPADGFAPHVTIAYASQDGPAAPILGALSAVTSAPATASVATVELIVLNRDQHMYQWRSHATAMLAEP
jgi:2'-5' RNA ligase